ncbi:MAG: hypothetical protein U0163_13705 [Gemmatimonadaceae bacterium]
MRHQRRDDSASNQWTTLASLTLPRAYTVTAAANGKLYTIGGSDVSRLLQRVSEYDPATNTWTDKAPLPTPLNSQLGAAVVGTTIYVPGGGTATPGRTTARRPNETTRGRQVHRCRAAGHAAGRS